MIRNDWPDMLIGSVSCDPLDVKEAMLDDDHGEVFGNFHLIKCAQLYLKYMIGKDVRHWEATDMVIMGILIVDPDHLIMMTQGFTRPGRNAPSVTDSFRTGPISAGAWRYDVLAGSFGGH